MTDQDPCENPPSHFTPSSHPKLAAFDLWMARHPWHPRIIPFGTYLVFLFFIQVTSKSMPWLYPIGYTLQCATVVWLLWRYRKLTPELTVSFHWLAVVIGVIVFVGWVALGWMMAGEWSIRWQALMEGQLLGRIDYAARGIHPNAFATTEPHQFEKMLELSAGLYWTSLVLRLLGMSIVVPLFEELFVRSLLLRSCSRFRPTVIGIVQIISDMPVVGEWLMHTKWGQKSGNHPPIFGPEFMRTPLGKLTLWGVTASTLVFMVHHGMRDWPGTIFCGIAYCLCVSWTARKGLGPVIWAHGITNALLWVYSLHTGDWQFM